MESNLYNRDNYVAKILPLSNEENKESCVKLLTHRNRHLLLCHNIYDDKYIQMAVESSNYILFHHRKENIEDIVGFALVALKKKAVDILLLCAAPNTEQFGNMIANSIYNFGIAKKYSRIYASPRTQQLRNTFLKYGFEHLRGMKDINEVLVKNINLLKFNRTNKTRKINRGRNNRVSNFQNFNNLDRKN